MTNDKLIKLLWDFRDEKIGISGVLHFINQHYSPNQPTGINLPIMQAEGSDGVKEAAVGQRSGGTNAEGQVCMQTLYCDVYNTKGICSYCRGKIVRKSSEGHL